MDLKKYLSIIKPPVLSKKKKLITKGTNQEINPNKAILPIRFIINVLKVYETKVNEQSDNCMSGGNLKNKGFYNKLY